MMKRSFLLIAAFGLLAGLAPVTPAHAGGYLVNIEQSVSVTDNVDQSIATVTLTYSGLGSTLTSTPVSSIIPSSAASTATGVYATFPPLKLNYENPVVTSGTNTVVLTYPTSVAYLNGTVSFDVFSTSDSASYLAGLVKLASITVTTEPSSDYTVTAGALHFTIESVPEPSSMALLGIGMTSFLAFRRFFKRTPVA